VAGQPHCCVEPALSTWQTQNNDYLAASLQWLRLRLTRMVPLAQPAEAPVAPPRAHRPWGSFLGLRPAPVAPAFVPASAPPPPRATDSPLAAAAAARAEAARMDPPPALDMLTERLGLSAFERDTLLLCAAVEIDPGIGSIFRQLQGHAARAAPSFALALQAFEDPSWDALSPHRPLRYARLIDIAAGGTTPLTTAPLHADERIVHYIKGLNVIDERLGMLLTPADDGSEPPLAPSQQQVAAAVMAQLQAAGAAAQVPLVQLVGVDAGSKLDVARQVCRQLVRRLYRLGIDALPPSKADLDALARLWQRERLLLPIALYLDADELQGASAELANTFASFTSRDIGLAFVGLRETPARPTAAALSFDVAKPSAREQHDAWARALAATPLAGQADSAAAALAGNFDLGLRDIGQGLALARAGAQQPLDLPQVWKACRQLTQPRLDQLAQRLEPKATWDDLVLSDEAVGLLRQVAGQVRNRFRVYEDWGYAARMTRGLGISALFAGESGTGKTMAAEVIANELDLALYRIDLSAVVSKYIGETEKNLRRLFDAAEQGGALLLFDEADALFGKRSEVKDSHDRYANIEINYLLQRMEAFSGLAILATNMKSALDNAFMRRLRFIVNFPYPGPVERRRMWERALPGHVPHETLDFERLSKLGLSGGNIHSIALNATFMAAARGAPVTQVMLMNAARTELRKLDKPVSEADFR
jgi:ATPase family associated with various cellular activities (AAA)